ncbi:MAG: hypothetical protein GTO40_22085 [Deltaproteobacteria bacterium]|nr:hypothetical protein [Deltaproteobacteria bacterium]
MLLIPAVAAAVENPMSHSLNWAVLFLIAMPYTIVASVIGWIIYLTWKGNQKRDKVRKHSPIMRLIVTPKEGGR